MGFFFLFKNMLIDSLIKKNCFMFKKYKYFKNFPALNFAITYGAIIFTSAVSLKAELVPITCLYVM